MPNHAEHSKRVTVVVGHEPPITSVVYFEPDMEHDSGFTILFADAPDADELADNDPRLKTVCLGCLIDEHPEVGRGLDLAVEHGGAERDDSTGDWTPA